jgi:Tfp pilus assembly protein FimV
MPDNLSSLITTTQQMLTALAATANATTVSGRGANAAFVTAGQAKMARVQQLNNEQEKLKADLKLKTAELAAAQKDLKAWYSEAGTIVKLAYKNQKEKWVEFGLSAKR